MTLKMKLTSTICAFLLILGLTIMGVMAAPSARVNLGGSLNFKATDVYANVYGKITGSKEAEAVEGEKKEINLDTLEFRAGKDTVTDGWKGTLENGSPNPKTAITFKDDGSEVTIKVTIENLSKERPLYATITDVALEVENVTRVMMLGEQQYNGDLLTVPAQVDGSTANIVEVDLVIDVYDPNKSISEEAIYGYQIELKDASTIQNTSEIKNLSFTPIEGTKEVSVSMKSTTETVGDVVIPSYVLIDQETGVASVASEDTKSADVYRVTEISGKAFYRCSNMVSITIPSTIKKVGSNAFDCKSISTPFNEGTTNLKKVFVEDVNRFAEIEFTNFKANPFSCRNDTEFYLTSDPETQITNLTLNKVANIGAYSFCSFEGLTNVTIGNSVEKIGNGAFYGCSGLTGEMVIPDNVKIIGVSAFSNCTSFINVKLPNGIRSIPERLFENCTKLENVVIPYSVTNIELRAFSFCGFTSLTIPDSVTEIGDYAFTGCTNLTDVTILKNVTTINSYAFQDCTSLKNIDFGSGVKTIGDFAFNNCTNIAKLIIPDNITTIGKNVFESCSSLKDVIIGSGLESIGTEAFDYCRLSNIIIDNAKIASGLTSKYVFGELIAIHPTVFINSDLFEIDGFTVGSYLTDTSNYLHVDKIESGEYAGYTRYANTAYEA